MTLPSLNQSPIVIIGSGAAGLYLASRLGWRVPVLLLESGPAAGFICPDVRNEIVTAGPYKNGQNGRARGLGGTTNIWGGQLLPFSEYDLSTEKGWPLTLEDLRPHYEAVSHLLLSESSSYTNQASYVSSHPLPEINNPLLNVHFSKWLANPLLSDSLARPLPPLVELRTHCTVVGIEPDGRGRYRLHCLDRHQSSFVQPASQVVVATGTIETVRLLMYSRHRYNLPVASGLGQGFMDHVSVDLCQLQPRHSWRFQRWFNTRRKLSGTRYSVRVSASREWLLKSSYNHNVSAMFMVRPPRHLWMRLLNAFCALASSLFCGFVFKPFGALMLNCMVEQASHEGKRFIALTCDGLPLIEWKPQEIEAIAALSFAREVVDSLVHHGWLSVPPHLPSKSDVLASFEDVCHPMGGAAMHVDSRRAVVGPDCELLHCKGIWVASGAVFPSGSHSNPTMTILALADRLAEKLLALF